MMETLRRGATSKVAVVVLFLPLIGAFALWGIGPEWRSGGQAWLAKVGNSPIYPEDFNRAYRNELDQISRRTGRQITPEQARYFGLDRQVLSRLAGSSALDQQVKKLGLTVPAQSITDSVRADPAFADITGKFSKARFDEILRQAGMSEATYLATRKRDDVREQLTDSILTGVAPAQAYIDIMNKYRGETRVVEFITIAPAKAVKIGEPDEAKLKAYYDGNTKLFVTPELRKIGVLLLTRAAVKNKIEVTDDEIKAAYESSKARYDIPEMRHVFQMPFADKSAAEKALPELAKAKDFVEAAVKLGATAADLDLGTLSKAKMIDAKIADAAFALKKGDVSKVVEGTFSTVVLKVVEITAGQQKTLADVAPQVKDVLQTQRATQEFQTIGNQVEDERSAGKPLPETAQKLGLEFKEIAAIDSTGNGADGKPAFENADVALIAKAAFSGAVGLDPDPVDLTDGGAAWMSVLGITPAKERPFDDVKADVKTAWVADEMRRELGSVAAKFVERMIKGEKLDAIAKDAGGKLEVSGAITRNTSPPGLTASAVQQAFALPKDGASSSVTADQKSRTVFKVTTINMPEPPSKAQSDQLKQELTQAMQADVLNTYVDGLQKKLGVNVNDAMLAQMLSGGGR